MENVECKIEGNFLVLRVDLGKSLGFTRGGQNVRIASSLGNQPVPSVDGRLRPEKWNLTVFRKLTPEERLTGVVEVNCGDSDEG